MYTKYLVMLLLGNITWAAKWTVDAGCDLVELKDLDNGFDPFVLATEEITVAMAEAITIAENAYNILNGPLEDQKLTDMVKMVFGDGSDYQTKVDAVKTTLMKVKSYEKIPSDHKPLSPEWQASMTDDDVMIFCTWKRIVKFGDHYKDTSMRNKPIGKSQMIEDPRYPSDGARSRCDTSSYDLQQTQGLTMAFTTTSNGYDLEGIKAAKIAAGPNGDVNKEDFGIRNRKLADTIDICRWYLHAMQLAGMPRINKDRIIQTQQPGFKASTIGHSMPVDGLRNVGATLLHELTHTNPGPLRDRRNRPAGTPSCYGWKCVQDLKDPTNADNVAMIALALHLWTMGYYVDKDGNVLDK